MDSFQQVGNGMTMIWQVRFKIFDLEGGRLGIFGEKNLDFKGYAVFSMAPLPRRLRKDMSLRHKQEVTRTYEESDTVLSFLSGDQADLGKVKYVPM